MSNDSPSFLILLINLFEFVLVCGMLLYILFFSSILSLNIEPIGYVITLIFICGLFYSVNNIYKMLFQARTI